MTRTISVLVATSEPLLRDVLALLLDQQNDIVVVGTAQDGPETLKKIRSLKPRVALLEHCLASLNGADIAIRAAEDTNNTRVVLLCRTKSDAVVQALAAGVPGCTCTMDSAGTLLQAIRAIATGSTFICPELSSPVRSSRLTRREREIITLVADGKTTKEIGIILGISEKTVDHHRTHLMEKLETHNVAGLTRFAIREGLILP